MIDLYDRVAKFFPIRGSVAELAAIDSEGRLYGQGKDNDAYLLVRLIVWDEGDGERSIRDVKEQQVYMGIVEMYENEARVEQMFLAMQEVLGELLSDSSGVMDSLMPHDLLPSTQLTLKNAHQREDFVKALSARSRLGKLLERVRRS